MFLVNTNTCCSTDKVLEEVPIDNYEDMQIKQTVYFKNTYYPVLNHSPPGMGGGPVWIITVQITAIRRLV